MKVVFRPTVEQKWSRRGRNAVPRISSFRASPPPVAARPRKLNGFRLYPHDLSIPPNDDGLARLLVAPQGFLDTCPESIRNQLIVVKELPDVPSPPSLHVHHLV